MVGVTPRSQFPQCELTQIFGQAEINCNQTLVMMLPVARSMIEVEWDKWSHQVLLHVLAIFTHVPRATRDQCCGARAGLFGWSRSRLSKFKLCRP